MFKLASVFVLIVISTNQTSSQSENCAPPERRSAAIRYAREINTMEAAAFGQLRSYQSLEQLPARRLPNDYVVQHTTDGTAYLFSIKDNTDPCHGALFSDQTGVIYTGVPIQ